MGGRLMVMVKPDAETARRLHAMAAAMAAVDDRRPYAAELQHITLFMLYMGHALPTALAARAVSGADRVRAPSFDVEFDRIAVFGGGRHIALTGGANPGLTELCARIAEGFARVSLAHRMVARRPHVTLIYNRGAVQPWTLAAPVRWTVRDFRLIWSEIGAHRHEELARWRLDPAPPGVTGPVEPDSRETRAE